MATTRDWRDGQHVSETPDVFEVEPPAGGKLLVRSQEEADLYTEMAASYQKDYRLVRQSELVLLGSILSQALELFRAQQAISGVKEKHDTSGVPLGEYVREELKPADRVAIQKIITESTKEIRAIEIALGIDKKSRDAGNQESVANYLSTLKRAGHRMGVHIHQRVLMYEKFVKELSWRIRLNKNGDAEDKKYHDLSPDKILAWAEKEIAEMEEFDKEYAKSQAGLFGGKL
jgi:hypothetical protein